MVNLDAEIVEDGHRHGFGTPTLVGCIDAVNLPTWDVNVEVSWNRDHPHFIILSIERDDHHSIGSTSIKSWSGIRT